MVRGLVPAIAFFSAIAVTGCLEVTVRTVVSADGSSERTVSATTEKRSLPAHGYPLPSDSGWTVSWSPSSSRGGQFDYSATRRFEDPDALAAEYAYAPDSNALRIAVSIDRDPGWFSTDLVYREVYTLRNPFTRIPARSFFSGEELDRIAAGEKSDSLNAKVAEWEYRNVYAEGFSRFVDMVGRGDAAVNARTLDGAREELYRIMRTDTAFRRGEDLPRGVLRLLGKALRTAPPDRYLPQVTATLAELDSMNRLRESADRWISSVEMPGALLGANGEAVGEREVRWTIESRQLLVTPVVMTAMSRVTNTWGIVVMSATALILVLFALRALRRRVPGRAVDSPMGSL